MSKKDVDEAFKTASDMIRRAQDAAASAAGQVDATLNSASSAARGGTAFVLKESNKMMQDLAELSTTCSAQLTAAGGEGVTTIREQVKQALQWAHEYPYAAYGIAATSILLFPAPRAYLVRNILGFMQSQESLFRAATEQSKGFKSSLETLLHEKQELAEKASIALQELTAARQRAVDAKTELARLSARMSSTARAMQDVTVSLRSIQAKEAVALRGDLARELADLVANQKSVDATVAQMANKGL